MTLAGVLAGKRVVVTRARAQADGFAALLERAGALALPFPTIEIVPPASWERLDEALSVTPHGAYEWVIFTSANSVHSVLSRIGDDPARTFARTRVAAVGSKTAALLRSAAVDVDLVPSVHNAEGLVAELGSGVGSVLLPRVEGAPRALVDSLIRQGWRVDEVAAYRNVPATPSEDEMRTVVDGHFDAVIFTSPSAVNNFVALVRNPGALGLTSHPSERRAVACIGPVTADAARAQHLRVDVVASSQSDEGLVEALSAFYGGHPGDGNIKG